MNEVPERIWLQSDDDPESDWFAELIVTWCQDKINDEDVEYILATKYAEMEAENERLRKKLHDILLVDTTDGMTASEWVDRTAKAESQLSQLRAATADANVGFMIQNKALKKANEQVAQLRKALEECQFLLRNYESCECDIMEPPCPKCIVLKEVDDALKGE